MSKTKPPWLDCPGCGEPVIEADGRGRHNADGEFVEHREACRCAWCDWIWTEGCEPVACKCGALVSTKEDEGYIYATVVNTPQYWIVGEQEILAKAREIADLPPLARNMEKGEK